MHIFSISFPRIINQCLICMTWIYILRYSLAYPTIFRKLMAMVPIVRESNYRLLQSKVCIDTGFNNFRLFINKKYQRDGTSATGIHANYYLVKRSVSVIPSVGSVLHMDGFMYEVMLTLQYRTYASLLWITLVNQCIRRLISWPSMGWAVVSLYGT